MRSEGEQPYESIAVVDFEFPFNSFTDSLSLPDFHSYRYKFHHLDECGFISETEDYTGSIYLSGIMNTDNTAEISWNRNTGVSFFWYTLYKGANPGTLPEYKTINSHTSRIKEPIPVDSAFYQIKATRSNNSFGYYEAQYPEVYNSLSNITKLALPEGVIRDTVIVYDTTRVLVYDTIKVEYKVMVTDTLFVRLFISNTNPGLTNTIKIFPNPASEVLCIHFGEYEHIYNYRIRLLDESGRIMFDQQCNTPEYEFSIRDSMESGLYFLHVLDENGSTVDLRKIIIKKYYLVE
jgi:hypothetical protein